VASGVCTDFLQGLKAYGISFLGLILWKNDHSELNKLWMTELILEGIHCLSPEKKQRKINKCEFLPKVLKLDQFRNQT
jgi:hypothetical protein